MRVLVTGGAGFIGSHLVERLFQRDHDVLLVDSLASEYSLGRLAKLEQIGIRTENLDVRQERLIRVAEDFKPDTIFHLAAQIEVRRSVEDPVLDAKINVIGTLRVLEAARAIGARVVFMSSGGVIYGEQDDSNLPVDEDALGRPRSPYGISKRVAEDYLRFYREVHRVPFVSLAPANVYGPRQDPHGESGVVAIFASKLLAGEPCVVFGDGKQTRDFVFVGDVVDALVAAIDKGEGETINIGTGQETSIDDLYLAMASICGVEQAPQHQPQKPGDLRRSCLEITKAAGVLGWKPRTSLQDGLRLTIDYFRTEAG